MESLPDYINGLLTLLLLTSFVKIATALSILRAGIGLSGANFGIVVFLLSFALAILSVAPMTGQQVGLSGLISNANSEQKREDIYRPVLEKQTDPEVLKQVNALVKRLDQHQQEGLEDGFPALMVAFLLSELKEAFFIGLLLLIPFLVIDVLVVNLLMVLEITQMSHQTLSLPLKLLLFFVLDGWLLITEKLFISYSG